MLFWALNHGGCIAFSLRRSPARRTQVSRWATLTFDTLSFGVGFFILTASPQEKGFNSYL